MNFQSYTTANTHLYTLRYFISLVKVKGIQLTRQALTQCKTMIGNMIRECKSIGQHQFGKRSSRELQTRLGLPMLVKVEPTYTYSEPSDIRTEKPFNTNHLPMLIRPSYNMTTNPTNEVLRTMKRIIIALLTLSLLGGLFMSTDMSMFTSLPMFMGISIFRRKRGNDDNAKTLPEVHNGLRDSQLTKEHYIAEQVEQVDKENVYTNQVSQVTRQAEDQWNRDHPDVERIRTNIVDNDYRSLVHAYISAGLDVPNAFCNSLNAIVRQYGSPNESGSYSVDKTFGQFTDFVEMTVMENEFRSELIINAMITLRDEYGVQFSPTTTAGEDKGEDIEIITPIREYNGNFTEVSIDPTNLTTKSSDDDIIEILDEDLIDLDDDDDDYCCSDCDGSD